MIKFFNLCTFALLGLITISCNKNDPEPTKTLKFSIAEEIPVPEPSGLDLGFDEKSFWVVSDQNSKVYLLDSRGKEIKSFKVDGEDLEGITIVDDTLLAIVLERTREVVILDTSGKELKRSKLKLKGELNSGLEGITYNPKEKKFYVMNEKEPILLLTLNENLEEESRVNLNFSKDASGIFYDDNDNTLWILSDEDKSIFKTDLAGVPIEEFKIKITQPEGITFNKARTKLYIVGDRTDNLYVFNLTESK